uniref:Uncharacterized protein n=1 Tax=Knipowitschia caucasica TaxID=637954 RepID=A0AAV2M544_KNICA
MQTGKGPNRRRAGKDGSGAPTEPLLCKFADGGQKKRQSQGKYLQNGRPWTRDSDSGGMALAYDPTALQNGFYSSPYSLGPNRMLAQTSLPYMHSPAVSSYQALFDRYSRLAGNGGDRWGSDMEQSGRDSNPGRSNACYALYQVHNPSWMHHQSYLMQPGAVLTPTMEHMSIQPTSIMGPLNQQLSHLTLGSSGTYIPANTSMQGTYIPQYTPVPPSNVQVEENGVKLSFGRGHGRLLNLTNQERGRSELVPCTWTELGSQKEHPNQVPDLNARLLKSVTKLKATFTLAPVKCALVYFSPTAGGAVGVIDFQNHK